MLLTAAGIWSSILDIRKSSPVIHNITNYVVMNNSANALLALGASPIMAHAREEMEEIVGIAGALVINIGTLSEHWISSMFIAAKEAKNRGIPIVLDPVGAGATTYRTNTAKKLIVEAPPQIIRGNASEIMALSDEKTMTRGVDSTAVSHAALDAAHRLNADCGSVVCVSGEVDYIVGDKGVMRVMNGHPLMTRVTGMGCIASAFCGTFAAVNADFAQAAAQAMAVMGIAGEIAVSASPGPGSLQVRFFDVIHSISAADIEERLKTDIC